MIKDEKEETSGDIFSKLLENMNNKTKEIIHDELLTNFKKLDSVKNWSDKTISEYMVFQDELHKWTENISTEYQNFKDWLEAQNKDVKSKMKQANIHWLVWLGGILLGLSLFFGFGWYMSRQFCSYSEVLQEHFEKEIDKKVEEVLKDKLIAANTEADKILKEAKDSAKDIIQKANERAAEIESNALVSSK